MKFKTVPQSNCCLLRKLEGDAFNVAEPDVAHLVWPRHFEGCLIDGAVQLLRWQKLRMHGDYQRKMKAIGLNNRLVWILLLPERVEGPELTGFGNHA